MQRHISIKNPRYDEYEVILQKLSKSIQGTQMTVTKDEHGQNNIWPSFAKEPEVKVMDVSYSQ